MATMVGPSPDQKTNETGSRPMGKKNRTRDVAGEEESATTVRFFLSKAGTGTSLELGPECATEGEARVEALKSGVTYYCVQEWRPIADCAGRNPELRREAVIRKGAG